MKKPAVNSKALRQGGYLAAVTAAVVALVVLVNLVMGQLPSNVTEFDLTDNSLYEITDTSKDFLATLDQDVEIVVLAEEDATDERILKFLDRYTALSNHLSLTYVDPVAHPDQASQYDAQSDSLIVRCEATGKSETISYSDIITYSYTSYFSMTEDAFDAEGQLTSAVNYVTSDADRTVYTVTGHGEEDLSSVITDAIDKANLNLDSVSPILNGSIPEDCDLLIVNGPATDLSADELTILQDYLTGGGQMIFLAGDTLDALPNWEVLLESRGFDLVDGYIADLGSYYPQFGSAFAICGAGIALWTAAGRGSVAVTILMLIVSTTCMTGASTMLLSLLPLRFHAMGRMATVTGLLNASAYVGSALASTGFGALSENGGWTAVLTAWLAISAAGMALCFFSRGVGQTDRPAARQSRACGS